MKKPKRKISEIPLEMIDLSGEVDRLDVDPAKIEELMGSIGEVGLLQPILLRPIEERYEIVAGRRRWEACVKLELDVIDAVVTKMGDEEAAIIRATENLARENLTPLEEAQIFSNLIGRYDLDPEDVGKRFGYKPGTVRRRMDLLKMPAVLQTAVHKKQIGVTVAEELWPISSEGDLNYYLTFAIESGCTRDTARGWAKDWKDSERRKKDAGGGGSGPAAATEPRPVYVACDLCVGPMEIGTETVIRLCRECYATIKAHM